MQMQAVLEPEFQSLTGASLEGLIREMLVRLGEDPERDGLQSTPGRMERSMRYLTKGYQEDPEETLLGAMFDVAYNEMVIVKDIEMVSLCEHQLLPFFGKVHVAYIPNAQHSATITSSMLGAFRSKETRDEFLALIYAQHNPF
jgi:GTP cyclohydrolase I